MYSRFHFRIYLKQLQISEITVKSYMRDAAKFCEYLKENDIQKIHIVTKQEIENYCEYLMQKGQAVVSIQRKIASIKKLFDFLHANGVVDENPVVGIKLRKTDKNKPKVLSKDEINKLLSMPGEITIIGIRDKAMLELVCATGIKVSELVNASIDSISLKSNTLQIKRRGKITKITLDSNICSCLKEYINKSRLDILTDNNSDFLFLNAYGKRLSRQGFWKILKKYSKKAELSWVTPETIRRSFAYHYVNEGNDINCLKDILGHSDIATTKAYIKIIDL